MRRGPIGSSVVASRWNMGSGLAIRPNGYRGFGDGGWEGAVKSLHSVDEETSLSTG